MTKVKRHKNMKKTMQFYKNNFGFEIPYKILIDGTFCKEALKNKVNIKEQLPKYFDSQLDLFTTYCAKAECEQFGMTYDMPLYGAKNVISQFPVHDCRHTKAISPSKCLLEMAKKKEHYFIATQEKTLTENLRIIPGTPILYLAFNTMTLERPSISSKICANDKLQRKLMPTNHEESILKDMKKTIIGELKESLRKKRKIRQGPNPLSCKKKKKTAAAAAAPKSSENKRKRKRKHQSKNRSLEIPL